MTSMTFRQITNSAFPLSNQTEKLSSGSRILAEGTAFRLSKREESRGGGGGRDKTDQKFFLRQERELSQSTTTA